MYITRCEIGDQSKFDAWNWCTETTQRDGMGRGVREGFRMGRHMYNRG